MDSRSMKDVAAATLAVITAVGVGVITITVTATTTSTTTVLATTTAAGATMVRPLCPCCGQTETSGPWCPAPRSTATSIREGASKFDCGGGGG